MNSVVDFNDYRFRNLCDAEKIKLLDERIEALEKIHAAKLAEEQSTTTVAPDTAESDGFVTYQDIARLQAEREAQEEDPPEGTGLEPTPAPDTVAEDEIVFSPEQLEAIAKQQREENERRQVVENAAIQARLDRIQYFKDLEKSAKESPHLQEPPYSKYDKRGLYAAVRAERNKAIVPTADTYSELFGTLVLPDGEYVGRKVTVIAGPPGSGKTYKIHSTIKALWDSWADLRYDNDRIPLAEKLDGLPQVSQPRYDVKRPRVVYAGPTHRLNGQTYRTLAAGIPADAVVSYHVPVTYKETVIRDGKEYPPCFVPDIQEELHQRGEYVQQACKRVVELSVEQFEFRDLQQERHKLLKTIVEKTDEKNEVCNSLVNAGLAINPNEYPAIVEMNGAIQVMRDREAEIQGRCKELLVTIQSQFKSARDLVSMRKKPAPRIAYESVTDEDGKTQRVAVKGTVCGCEHAQNCGPGTNVDLSYDGTMGLQLGEPQLAKKDPDVVFACHQMLMSGGGEYRKRDKTVIICDETLVQASLASTRKSVDLDELEMFAPALVAALRNVMSIAEAEFKDVESGKFAVRIHRSTFDADIKALGINYTKHVFSVRDSVEHGLLKVNKVLKARVSDHSLFADPKWRIDADNGPHSLTGLHLRGISGILAALQSKAFDGKEYCPNFQLRRSTETDENGVTRFVDSLEYREVGGISSGWGGRSFTRSVKIASANGDDETAKETFRTEWPVVNLTATPCSDRFMKRVLGGYPQTPLKEPRLKPVVGSSKVALINSGYGCGISSIKKAASGDERVKYVAALEVVRDNIVKNEKLAGRDIDPGDIAIISYKDNADVIKQVFGTKPATPTATIGAVTGSNDFEHCKVLYIDGRVSPSEGRIVEDYELLAGECIDADPFFFPDAGVNIDTTKPEYVQQIQEKIRNRRAAMEFETVYRYVDTEHGAGDDATFSVFRQHPNPEVNDYYRWATREQTMQESSDRARAGNRDPGNEVQVYIRTNDLPDNTTAVIDVRDKKYKAARAAKSNDELLNDGIWSRNPTWLYNHVKGKFTSKQMIKNWLYKRRDALSPPDGYVEVFVGSDLTGNTRMPVYIPANVDDQIAYIRNAVGDSSVRLI